MRGMFRAPEVANDQRGIKEMKHHWVLNPDFTLPKPAWLDSQKKAVASGFVEKFGLKLSNPIVVVTSREKNQQTSFSVL